MMSASTWVTFGGLKGFVNRKTKELIVPSKKKLVERKTEVVIHGRFGRFRKIKVVQDGKTVFMTAHEGVFEDMTLYPVGGCLEGHDLSVINRRVVVRWGDVVAFCIDDKDTDVMVYINGEEEADRGSEWELSDDEDDTADISVFMDGTVLYEAGGRMTTFSLCKCRDQKYKSVTRGVRISEEELATLSWNVRLTMYAERRLEHNSLNHKKEIDWSSDDKDDDDGDGDGDADDGEALADQREHQRPAVVQHRGTVAIRHDIGGVQLRRPGEGIKGKAQRSDRRDQHQNYKDQKDCAQNPAASSAGMCFGHLSNPFLLKR